MRVVGSSKLISDRELLALVLLGQQSCLFWLLPYLLTREAGTAGLLSLLAILPAGLAIVLVSSLWNRCRQERNLVQSMEQLLGRPLGWFTAFLLLLAYLGLAVVHLGSLQAVVGSQLLPHTPKLLLGGGMLLLMGWLSWNGLEDLSRMALPGLLVLAVLLVTTAVGVWDVLQPEHVLPVLVAQWHPLGRETGSALLYGLGLLVLFPLYPARNETRPLTGRLVLVLLMATALVLLWLLLGLGALGSQGASDTLWLPVELARMVHLGPFLERAEALFAMGWLAVLLLHGALLLWCVSETVHQLVGQSRTLWLHSLIVVLFLLPVRWASSLLHLLQLEQMLCGLQAVLLPLVLLMVLVGCIRWKTYRRGDGAYGRQEGP